MKKRSSMLNLLCAQADQVWSFQDHIFESLGGREVEGGDIPDEQVELIAALLDLHVAPGTQIQMRIGTSLLMARAESSIILLAWCQQGGNPMLLGSFLEQYFRCHATSRANQSRLTDHSSAMLPEVPQPIEQETLEAETAVQEEPKAPEVMTEILSEQTPSNHATKPEQALSGSASAADKQPMRATGSVGAPDREATTGSGRRWERDRQTGNTISLKDQGTRKIESVSIGAEDSEPISFDLEYESSTNSYIDVPSPAPPEPTRRSDPPSARQNAVLWVDFEAIVQSMSELAERLLGRRIVANYWSRAYEPSADILAGLVNYERGQGLSFVEPTATVIQQEASALLVVIDRWLQSCERVVPGEAKIWRRMVGEELNNFWSTGEPGS